MTQVEPYLDPASSHDVTFVTGRELCRALLSSKDYTKDIIYFLPGMFMFLLQCSLCL